MLKIRKNIFLKRDSKVLLNFALSFLLLLLPEAVVYVKAQSPNLTKVYPDYGNNSITVEWAPVAGAAEYQIKKREGVNPFGAWVSTGTTAKYTDPGLTVNVLYSYRVRVKVGANWVDSSKIRSNKIAKVWPVSDGANFNTEARNLLDGFNQSINAGGSQYLHEGLDINGNVGVGDDWVKSAVGGVVTAKTGVSPGLYFNLEFFINGVRHNLQFNHLKNPNPNLNVGESVMPGDTLGQIDNAVGGWNTQCFHTHFHYWTSSADFWGSTSDPHKVFDAAADRDPQGSAPRVIDTNGDAEDIRFKKKNTTSAYFAAADAVYLETDIVAEACDKQSTGDFNVAPKSIGYYIERHDATVWKNAVKSSASPYILVDNAEGFFNSSSAVSNPLINLSLHDVKESLKSIAPITSANYVFKQWWTYVVTNTKGTDGKIANLDSSQCWATNARTTVAADNGYASGYDKARANAEAKFNDGKYRVGIRLTDYVNTPADKQKEVLVDNFIPYIEKVEITSGGSIYEAHWTWNSGSGILQFTANTQSGVAKCNQDLVVIITSSESMKEISLSIPKLTFNTTVLAPEPNSEAKKFKFTVAANNFKNGPKSNEPIPLIITGKDLSNNQLFGFASKSDLPAASLPVRKDDGTWTVNNAFKQDTLHKIRIKRPQFEVTSTDVTCHTCTDGTATVTPKAGLAPYTFDWSNGKKQAGINGLAPGAYTVTVADASGCDSIGNATVKGKPKPPDPFVIPVVASSDPNDITGPAGYGNQRWVSVNDKLNYLIRFENDPKFATAAVNKVAITLPIDLNASMFTFTLGDFTFRDFVVQVPENTSHYFKRMDLVDSIGVFIDVTAGLDVTKKQAFWIFQAIDPVTGFPNINPELGFLPINDSLTHSGEGSVRYNINPRMNAKTGDSIKAQAEIIFDINAPLRTNTTFNTIDAKAPSSEIMKVEYIMSDSIRVSWNGIDDKGGSGVAEYKLLISTNNGPYNLYDKALFDTTTDLKLYNGYNYKIQTIGLDHANNTEKFKPEPDTTIEVIPEGFIKIPNQSSKYCGGSRLSVRWNMLENVNKFYLQLSADSGKTYTTIANNVYITDSVFTWDIPRNIAGNNNYKLKAANSLNNVTIGLSSYFVINNGVFVKAGNDKDLCIGDSVMLGEIPLATNGAVPYAYNWTREGGSFSSKIGNPFTKKDGNYFVTATDARGCWNADTVLVVEHILPDVFIQGLDSTYMVTANTDTLYGFPEGGAFTGTGMLDNIFSPTVAGLGKHQIKYAYKSPFGCASSVTSKTAVIGIPSASSIADIEKKNLLIVYPNPVKDEFTLKLSTAKKSRGTISLYNMQGAKIKIIKSGMLHNEKIEVNVSKLYPGTYCLQVLFENDMLIEKIVKH